MGKRLESIGWPYSTANFVWFFILHGMGWWWFLLGPAPKIYSFWDLGLHLLVAVIGMVFLSEMIRDGYTKKGLIFLVFPATACIFLIHRLFSLTLEPTAVLDLPIMSW